jgi:aromatic-L-amino-acid decarboxylase
VINKSESDKVHEILDWVLDYLKNNEKYDVLPDIEPGQIYNNQGKSAPVEGDFLENVFSDFEKQVLPGITHWNHPGFSAYFNSSSTLPSVVAEMISAAINTNTMLWKSSPAGTEIEQKTLEWLQEILGLSGFTGITYEGGSTSSFHGLAAMREAKLGPEYRKKGLIALANSNPTIYITEQTHNSIQKALITLGFGTDSFRYVNVDDDFTMDTKHNCINNYKISA